MRNLSDTLAYCFLAVLTALALSAAPVNAAYPGAYPLPVTKGGTGSATQTFIDTGGAQTKTGALTVTGGVKMGTGTAPTFAAGTGGATPVNVATTTSGEASVACYVNDGTRNRRIKLFIDDTNAANGITWTNASSSINFVLNYNGTNVWTCGTSGEITETGAHIFKTRVATSSPVTVSRTTDQTIITKLSVAGAVAVNFPSSPGTGLTYVVKDGTGDAATNNITVTPNAGTIDGAGTSTITTNYGVKTYVYNGTEWNVL